MNSLQCFALINFGRDGRYWSELVTVRAGELSARRSVFSLERGRAMMDALCNRHNVTDRAGCYVGAIMRPGKAGVPCN